LGGRDLITRLVEDYKACWPSSADSKASLFQNWREANVFTLYKGKGDKKDPNNFRRIFLLDVAGKLLAKIIHNRLLSMVEGVLADSQFGFRPHTKDSQ
jgi:hypothetical protein